MFNGKERKKCLYWDNERFQCQFFKERVNKREETHEKI